MSSGWRVVLQIDTPQRSECYRFATIPVLDPAHISVVAEAPQASNEAERLYLHLKTALSALSAHGSAPDYCGGPKGLGCMARGEPTCRSLLVVVTGRGRISQNLELLMLEWQRQRPQRSTVLPILPAGATPGAILPPPLDRLIALFNSGPIEFLAPDVLRAAGIGGSDHRLFISYRRDAAQDLAEQLHDAFTQSGFRVFLDRFSGTPGRPFPRVLAEELADKGLMLVLESQQIRSSSWTLAEVAFARALRLGLLALSMRGSPRFQTISGADRHIPGTTDWKPGPRGETLTDPACRAAVDFVRQRYAEQILYRQLYLENLLHRALARHGLQASAAGGGTFFVSGANHYAIHLSSRPPRLGEVRRATETAFSTGAHPVVVGAHRFLPPGDAADLEWLAGTLGTSLRSEGILPRLASSFAAGLLPP